jgi:hypothetical protein
MPEFAQLLPHISHRTPVVEAGASKATLPVLMIDHMLEMPTAN